MRSMLKGLQCLRPRIYMSLSTRDVRMSSQRTSKDLILPVFRAGLTYYSPSNELSLHH